MNGSNKILKIVIDTNVLFMSLYNPNGKAGKIIDSANEGKLELFSPESVKIEILRVLKREMDLSESELDFIIESLPVKWIEESIYSEALGKTKVKHKADKPIEALSLILDCGILSADYHFKNRIDINKLLKSLE